MSGETDLDSLLSCLKPELNAGEYVFCSAQTDSLPKGTEAVGWFREREGTTLILPRHRADALGLPYSFVSAWITLTVHSALEAVGLTAAVSQALASAGISCNVVAASYHDHLFVPAGEARRAMEILINLSAKSRAGQQS
jgi:hypothetical protein